VLRCVVQMRDKLLEARKLGGHVVQHSRRPGNPIVFVGRAKPHHARRVLAGRRHQVHVGAALVHELRIGVEHAVRGFDQRRAWHLGEALEKKQATQPGCCKRGFMFAFPAVNIGVMFASTGSHEVDGHKETTCRLCMGGSMFS
jgi:hypothetical protein